jgi:hypothetical protein
MIKKFKQEEYEYINAIKLAWLFIVSEVIEYLKLFNAYDQTTQSYNVRRTIWIFIITAFSVFFISLITTTCIAYLVNL